VNSLIREATFKDAERLNEIANWYIENKATNFDLDSWTLAQRLNWVESFNQPDSPYYLLVCESDNQVIGFACNTSFRPKAAYRSSTETSVYIAHDIQSQGRGRKLYDALFTKISAQSFHRAYAVITLPNDPSLNLHLKMQFTEVGFFDEIGYKFGQYHSVAMYERKLDQVKADNSKAK
jgi:phosphinothricin acetyltransferase